MDNKIIIVLDNVRSSFNVGAIFRTCDGLGAQLHLIGITPVPGKDTKLDKTSLNAMDFVKWKYFENREDWFKHILLMKEDPKETNMVISVEESKDLQSVSLFSLEKKLQENKNKNIYIVFGHEINGVNEFLINKSDFVLEIPMYGKKNSLNIATCVGIVGYRTREILEKISNS